MMMSNSKFVPDISQQYQAQQQLEQQQFNLNAVASGKHYLSFGFESLPPIIPPQYQDYNFNTQPTPKPRIWTQTDMFDNNAFMQSFQHIDQPQPQPLHYTPVLPTVSYSSQDRDRSPLSPDDIIAEEAITKAIASAEASAVRPAEGKPLRRKRRKNSEVDPNGPHYPCETCGKVFNKPYNLKSHLKTHSNEKPYLCQFCGKGFARGHDRKRHERLHDGSKKFRCMGTLKNGEKWGCNREFARADALGRHFRTENGWICIRPLMNEVKEMDINQLTDMISGQQK